MSWSKLPRPNPCLPCMVGNPKPGPWKIMDAKTKNYRCEFCVGAIDPGQKYGVIRGKPYHPSCYEGKLAGAKKWKLKNPCPPSVHIDMPGSHSARGKGAKTYEKNANPSEDRRRLRMLDRMIQSRQPEYDDEELRSYAQSFSEFGPAPRDAARVSRSPRLKAQADLLGGYPLHPAGLKHNEKKRAAALAEFRAMPKKNPKLMVLNPSSDPLCAAIERRIKRRLTAREKALLAQAAREFKTFHGRAASPSDIMPVEAPPGTPLVVSMIGRLDRTDYTVPIDGSERKGRWTHEAGDHGRKYKTPKPYLAAIPGRKTHNTVIVQPKGAKTYFKPTHGLMG